MEPNFLLEKSTSEADCGEMVGRDPRNISAEEWERAGLVEVPTGMKAIRAKCLDCACNFSEVRKCTATTCPLWPLRMGTKPLGLREARGEKIKTKAE